MRISYKFVRVLLWIIAVLIIGIVLLAAVFYWEQQPNSAKERKVKERAEIYLQEHFQESTTVYDVLFDSMGNYGMFDYAAMVRHDNNKTEFLVYYNDNTKKMEDTYLSSRWRDEAEKKIKPYLETYVGKALTLKDMKPFINGEDYDEIQKKLKGKTQLSVLFDQEEVWDNYVNANEASSYEKYEISPTIRITIPRKQKVEDEVSLKKIFNTMKADGVMKRGTVVVEYIKENGEILEDKELRFDI